MKSEELKDNTCVEEVKTSYRFFKSPYNWWCPNGGVITFDEMDKRLEKGTFIIAFIPEESSLK